MKKLILVFVAIAIAAGAYAQIDSTSRMSQRNVNYNPDLRYNTAEKSLPDGVVMKNGVVMKVEDGEMTILDDDMTMGNGTKITSDGTWTKSDGTEKVLEEGQHIDMSGNMTTMDDHKDNDMDNMGKMNHNKSDDKSHCDGVVMQNGQMMKVKNGETTTLDEDMTMSNGTIIYRDGKYTDKDGKELRLQEGEHMDMSGKMTSKRSNDDNMYLIDDKKQK